MSVPIEINYLDPNKPRGNVGGVPSVRVGESFHVFSHDGPLKFSFKGDSPFAQDTGELPGGDVDHFPTKPGRYKFACRIHVNGRDIELDPDAPEGPGGEMEVIP